MEKVDKSFKPGLSFPSAFKCKNSSKNSNFPNNKKMIQCKEYESFRHIPSECANTRKKENKALESTWSDEESNSSQEEDDLVSNQIAFSGTLVSGNHLFMQGRSDSVAIDTICLSAKLDTVVTDSKLATNSLCDSDLEYGDEFVKDDESLQEAYERMYTQRLKVCVTNRALNGEIQALRDLT